MPTVNADDLETAVTLVSDQNYLSEAWVSRETGKVYVRTDEADPVMDEVPDDVEDDEQYVSVPDARSLDLGHTLVFNFVEAEMAPDYDQVRQMFRRSGAYGRFSRLVDNRGLRDQWHRFRNEQTRAALAAWCNENGLTLAA
jgi:hypothetical protein